VTSSLKKLLADCFKTVADDPKTALLAARAISSLNSSLAAAAGELWPKKFRPLKWWCLCEMCACGCSLDTAIRQQV